jgi:hypothetical protein
MGSVCTGPDLSAAYGPLTEDATTADWRARRALLLSPFAIAGLCLIVSGFRKSFSSARGTHRGEGER